MKIDPEYQKLLLQIKQDGEKYADQQMRVVYGEQKNGLTELHKYLGLLYVKNAVDGLLNVTPAQKKAILSDVDQQIISAQKSIGSAEIQAVSEILKHNYGDMYYKTAYVMDSGLKAGIKFGMLKKEYVDSAVNSPVDGEIFSDRIWGNKAAVADQLKESFVNALNGDTTIDKIGQEIQRAFNVQAYESQRLVHTENARVQSAAIDDIGKSAGCSQQMFCATLEANTCSECAELDGKYFDIDDDSKPDIPVHPECRCVYINVPPVPGWTPLKRRNNETGEDIGYEDYAQWAAEKGIKNDEKNDSSDGESDIIALQTEIDDIGIKGQVIAVEPLQISSIDEHAAQRFSERDISQDDVQSYIDNAKICLSVWDGQVKKYYSDDGAAYVQPDGLLKTAYPSKNYDDKTMKMMEAIKKHGAK